MRILLLALLLLSTVLAGGERIQGVSVRGRLLCGAEPMHGVVVKIIDKDHDGDRDDLLDESVTDSDGRFEVSGATAETGWIEPAIKIYHDCNDAQPCQRKVIWDIPSKYIHNSTVNKWMEIGEVNMELIFKNEERDCRHKRRRSLRDHHGRRHLHRRHLRKVQHSIDNDLFD